MEEQKQEQAPVAQPVEPISNEKDVQENKLWALLGYLGILCLIPLLAKKDSKFAQFHAKQGLILLIGEFFVWIPFLGWILGIIIFVFWIMGVINVFSGKMKPLPIIGELAAKINI
jgi:uncharacterized membrane protein